MLSIFSYACGSFLYLFWAIVYSRFSPIFNIRLFVLLLLSCRSSLYFLDINFYMSDIRLANIFSHSANCLFILLIVFFAAQKFLSLLLSPVFLASYPSNYHQIQCLESCLLYFLFPPSLPPSLPPSFLPPSLPSFLFFSFTCRQPKKGKRNYASPPPLKI